MPRKPNAVPWKGIILFLLPALALYTAYFLYPLGFVFFTGLHKWNGIAAPKFMGLQNYVDLWKQDIFRLAVRNNFLWALVLGLVQVPLAALVAMVLARRPKGWRFLRTIYFVPNVISMVAIAMMWQAIYNAEFGLLNKILEIIGLEGAQRNWLGEIGTALPAVMFQQVVYIGYFMIIILAALMAIPESYYEAAKIDGANAFRQEIHITLPLLRGILATSMTLAVAYGLRHFEATFLMTRGGPANSTNVLGILMYGRMSNLNYGIASSIGSTLIVLGVIVIIVIRNTLGRRDPAAEITQ